jgi:hypothetical protein
LSLNLSAAKKKKGTKKIIEELINLFSGLQA